MRVSGPAPHLARLEQEAGPHRWQRVPPNDRQKRVHTSTVTVAVMRERERAAVELSREDVEMRFTRDRGPGGQHKNKTDSCVVLTHKATGMSVKVDGRSQHQNRRAAFSTLADRLTAMQEQEAAQRFNAARAEQIGNGERGGNRIRTYREQDNRVTDHRTGVSTRLSALLKGELELMGL